MYRIGKKEDILDLNRDFHSNIPWITFPPNHLFIAPYFSIRLVSSKFVNGEYSIFPVTLRSRPISFTSDLYETSYYTCMPSAYIWTNLIKRYNCSLWSWAFSSLLNCCHSKLIRWKGHHILNKIRGIMKLIWSDWCHF